MRSRDSQAGEIGSNRAQQQNPPIDTMALPPLIGSCVRKLDQQSAQTR